MLELYVLNVGQTLDERYKAIFLEQISEERKNQIDRYRRPIDGQRTLMGEILIKVMLAKHLRRPVKGIKFLKNEYGKPYLEDKRLYFNISHSGEWVMGAISDQPVGVDVEQVKKADLDIAKRFFSEAEYKSIEEISDVVLCNEAFYTMWSGKESYIKLIGKGLTIPLNEFCLQLKQQQLKLIDAYEGIRANFKVYPIDPGNYSFVMCSPKEIVNSDYVEVSYKELYDFLVAEAYFDNPLKRD